MADNLSNPNPQWQGTSEFSGYWLVFGDPNTDPLTNPRAVEDTNGVNLGNQIQLNQYGSPTQNINLTNPPYSYQLYTNVSGAPGAPVTEFQHPEFWGLSDIQNIATGLWEEVNDNSRSDQVVQLNSSGSAAAALFDPIQLRIGDVSTNDDLFVPDGIDYKFNSTFNNGTFTDEDILVTQSAGNLFFKGKADAGHCFLTMDAATGFQASLAFEENDINRIVMGWGSSDVFFIQQFDATGSLFGSIYSFDPGSGDTNIYGGNAGNTGTDVYIKFNQATQGIEMSKQTTVSQGGLVPIGTARIFNNGTTVVSDYSEGISISGTRISPGVYSMTLASAAPSGNVIYQITNRNNSPLIFSYDNESSTTFSMYTHNTAGAAADFIRAAITVYAV